MSKSSFFVSLASVLSLASLASLVACGSAPPGESTGRTGQAATLAPSAPADPQFTGCVMDDDCVAIPTAGCCDNGWLVAVNRCSQDGYDAANVCQTASPICPAYFVNDTRVAVCDQTTNACTLVQSTAASTDDAGAGDDAGAQLPAN